MRSYCCYQCLWQDLELSLKYGIIFWGNSPNSKVFTLQKKTVRLMAGVKPTNSCGSVFTRFEILALPCEHICSLMKFTVNKQEHFKMNSAIHSVNTRNKNQIHRPIANLSCFQESAYYAGIKIFNSLPSSLVNKNVKFKVGLKRYLITHCFYSVDVFLIFTNKS
jgi:hypothetical protein